MTARNVRKTRLTTSRTVCLSLKALWNRQWILYQRDIILLRLICRVRWNHEELPIPAARSDLEDLQPPRCVGNINLEFHRTRHGPLEIHTERSCDFLLFVGRDAAFYWCKRKHSKSLDWIWLGFEVGRRWHCVYVR